MVIVGRALELAEIAAVLEAARHGAGASLCLVGEPGIGKTTLLDAAARSAAGFLVLRATGVPAELSLGHGALLALLILSVGMRFAIELFVPPNEPFSVVVPESAR